MLRDADGISNFSKGLLLCHHPLHCFNLVRLLLLGQANTTEPVNRIRLICRMPLPIQAFHIAPTHHHAWLYFAAQDVPGQFSVLTEGDKLLNGHLHFIAERLFSAGAVATTLGDRGFLQVAQPTEQADLHFRRKPALCFRKNQLGFHLLPKGAAHQRVNLRSR